MSFQLINLREVQQRLPRSRSTVYAEIAKSVFPRPLKVGRGSFWRDDEIDDLIAAYARGAASEDLRSLCEGFYERRERR
jgi:prophage regulatory protein